MSKNCIKAGRCHRSNRNRIRRKRWRTKRRCRLGLTQRDRRNTTVRNLAEVRKNIGNVRCHSTKRHSTCCQGRSTVRIDKRVELKSRQCDRGDATVGNQATARKKRRLSISISHSTNTNRIVRKRIFVNRCARSRSKRDVGCKLCLGQRDRGDAISSNLGSVPKNKRLARINRTNRHCPSRNSRVSKESCRCSLRIRQGDRGNAVRSNLRNIRNNSAFIAGHGTKGHLVSGQRIGGVRPNEGRKLRVRQRDRIDPIVRNLVTMSKNCIKAGRCHRSNRNRIRRKRWRTKRRCRLGLTQRDRRNTAIRNLAEVRENSCGIGSSNNADCRCADSQL